MKKYTFIILLGGLLFQPLYAKQTVVCEELPQVKDIITCFLPYAKRGSVNVQARMGTYLLEEKEYESAVYWLSLAADKKQLEAMNNLALAYELGLGVEVDSPRALRLYEEAAQLGNSFSQHQLGLMYLYGTSKLVNSDINKAKYWFEMAAKQNNTNSLYVLGELYFRGDYVTQDIQKGLEYYINSAKLGDYDAQHTLGILYEKGYDVPRDCEKALYWYDMAKKNNAAGDEDEDDADYEGRCKKR